MYAGWLTNYTRLIEDVIRQCIPVHDQHLLYTGNELTDQTILSTVNIGHGALLLLVIGLKTGPLGRYDLSFGINQKYANHETLSSQSIIYDEMEYTQLLSLLSSSTSSSLSSSTVIFPSICVTPVCNATKMTPSKLEQTETNLLLMNSTESYNNDCDVNDNVNNANCITSTDDEINQIAELLGYANDDNEHLSSFLLYDDFANIITNENEMYDYSSDETDQDYDYEHSFSSSQQAKWLKAPNYNSSLKLLDNSISSIISTTFNTSLYTNDLNSQILMLLSSSCLPYYLSKQMKYHSFTYNKQVSNSLLSDDTIVTSEIIPYTNEQLRSQLNETFPSKASENHSNENNNITKRLLNHTGQHSEQIQFDVNCDNDDLKIPSSSIDILQSSSSFHSSSSSSSTSYSSSINSSSCSTTAHLNQSRCYECNRRTRLACGFTCRCERWFCTKHHHPEDHQCNFKFKTILNSI
ncbi:hypothetical protein MN116_007967 [Schistosoma mekongi]|uniref:AN1-type domain-containing protein n=1 Tax=Schistosoma mekongi TaxID=38744 RepID=A0AAE1Z7N0_SCHME|nr:hypothetical protein MN116_007967 [Schistosoma mekongi]